MAGAPTLDPYEYLILAKPDVNHFVQFAVHEEGAIRAEAVANQFAIEWAGGLTVEDYKGLDRLGWKRPRPSAGRVGQLLHRQPAAREYCGTGGQSRAHAAADLRRANARSDSQTWGADGHSGQRPYGSPLRLAFVAGSRVATAKDPRWQSLQMPAAEKLDHRTSKIRAVEPQFSTGATLLLQLRQGMGVGAKADVLSFVLGLNSNAAEWASISMIAESVGYTTTAVRRVADDLAAARFIRTLEVPDGGGAARMFSAHPAHWASLLGVAYAQPGWGFPRMPCDGRPQHSGHSEPRSPRDDGRPRGPERQCGLRCRAPVQSFEAPPSPPLG